MNVTKRIVLFNGYTHLVNNVADVDVVCQEEMVKIFKATYSLTETGMQPGAIVCDRKNRLCIAAQNGFIEVSELQLAGKKRMLVTDFLRGFKYSGTEKMIQPAGTN